ncbi:MAG: cation transporting ATPase C-terminal domain-containing protein [Acidimicrobiales bacterium]
MADLLNNLLYDFGQLAIPTDRVDDEVLVRPAAWDIAFVRRFMSIFGPISSIFDFTTFFVMLVVLDASHAEFRSGWFVESLATQTLVVFVIRTRRVPFFRSRPSVAMIITPIACAVIGAALPFTPLADALGFTTLPISFFLILVGMIITYLALVEVAKSRFYAAQAHPHRTALTHEQRRQRRIARRAVRYVRHSSKGSSPGPADRAGIVGNSQGRRRATRSARNRRNVRTRDGATKRLTKRVFG